MFDQLNRVQQVEMIQRKLLYGYILYTKIIHNPTDYKNLKTELSTYFKEFADKGKVELLE